MSSKDRLVKLSKIKTDGIPCFKEFNRASFIFSFLSGFKLKVFDGRKIVVKRISKFHTGLLVGALTDTKKRSKAIHVSKSKDKKKGKRKKK